MCFIDGDRCEVWRETERRARKVHTCASCGASVPQGELYVRHFSVGDGYVCDVAVCRPCADARAEFVAEHGMVYQPPETMEMFRSCLDEIRPEDCTPAERRAWVAKRAPSEARWRTLLAGMTWRWSRARAQRRRAERGVR